jgi:capsular polysaccharide biosynthesis protein
VNYTLLSTTAWAPDTVPGLLITVVIALVAGVVIVVVLVVALMALRTRPRKR